MANFFSKITLKILGNPDKSEFQDLIKVGRTIIITEINILQRTLNDFQPPFEWKYIVALIM